MSGKKVVDQVFFATGSNERARAPEGWEAVSWQDVRASSDDLNALASPASPPGVWAVDLLTMVTAVYLADRVATYRDLRSFVPWQREIHLDVPVQDPDRWQGPALSKLQSLLGYLTGDVWHITARRGVTFEPAVQGAYAGEWRAQRVALFSGGLDSTGAAAYLAAHASGPQLLVSYDHASLATTQRRVVSALRRMARAPIEHRSLSYSLSTQATSRMRGNDSSFRTRALRFIGTGVYVAAAHRLHSLIVPENGQLAVNPPLDASRIGYCSTRSVHPQTLFLVNQLISELGGDVAVENSLLEKTKGEVCRLALESGLDDEALLLTNSCSKPFSDQRAGNTHCGACFACLVRKSGLRAAGVADRTKYVHSLRDHPLDNTLADNVRALALWLRRAFTKVDLVADLPLPPGVADTVMPTLQRGRRELAMMLEAESGIGTLATPTAVRASVDSTAEDGHDPDRGAIPVGVPAGRRHTISSRPKI